MFLASFWAVFQQVFFTSYSFSFTMVNNSMPRSTFNSLAAGFIPSSSSQSTSTSPTDPAAILSSVANVSQPATSATSSTVVLSSTAPSLFLPNVFAAAVAQAIGNTLPAIVSALQSNSRPVSTAPANLRAPKQEPQTYLERKLIVSSSKRRLVEVKDILTWMEAFTIY